MCWANPGHRLVKVKQLGYNSSTATKKKPKESFYKIKGIESVHSS
jgi:hypothetical protein